MRRKLLCTFIISTLLLCFSSILISAEDNSPYDEHLWSENNSVICGTYNEKFVWWLDTEKGTCGIQGSGVLENVRNLKKYNSLLKSLTIDDGFSEIGEGSLEGLSMSKFTIPSSVTVIGKEAFADCTSLEKITIPRSVTYIGKEAFAGCASLKEVYIYSDSVTVDQGAFDDCPELKRVKFYGDEIEIKEGNDRLKDLVETKFADIALPAVVAIISIAVIAMIAFICIQRSKKNVMKEKEQEADARK